MYVYKNESLNAKLKLNTELSALSRIQCLGVLWNLDIYEFVLIN